MWPEPEYPRAAKHAVLVLAFVSLSLLLSRPEFILVSKMGFTAWYPATGLLLAIMLGISPWYGIAACITDLLSAPFIYHEPVLSFSHTLGPAGISACYAVAAYGLRSRLGIDVRLRNRRDIVDYICVSMSAAVGATVVGITCLVADRVILPSEYWRSGLRWFVGDAVALLGFAPFLLVHIFPRVRAWVWSAPAATAPGPETVEIGIFGIAEGIGQGLVLLATLWIMFGPVWGHLELSYLCFIPIMWIAMRQGIRRVTTGTTLLNFGIVSMLQVFPPSAALLAKIDVLMLSASGAGLLMGTVVSERHRMAIELTRQADALRK